MELETRDEAKVRDMDLPDGQHASAALDDADMTVHVLRARARRLADIPPKDESDETVGVLVFRIFEARYAVQAALLRLVHRGASLTPVPCAPPFVAGMLNVRGEVLTVLNLGIALGLHGTASTDDRSSILLAECAGVRVGLLVDEVLAIRPLALNRMDPPLSEDNFALGVVEAQIVFLDLEKLLLSGRFDVLEDVS